MWIAPDVEVWGRGLERLRDCLLIAAVVSVVAFVVLSCVL